jgi:hypothetical protein
MKWNADRRRLLGGLAYLANLSFRILPPAGVLTVSRPAKASPQAALLIAETCISVIRLCSPNGPGLDSLLSLQMDVLQAISAQLNVIQQTLVQIFNDLQYLKQIVREVPESTVIELYKAKISGAIRGYDEVMLTYEADRSHHGTDYASKQNLQELSGLIDQIREARQILFGYENEVTIPIVAAGMQTEIHCMIMAGIRDTRLRNALASYHNWFANWFAPKNPKSLPKKCLELNSKLMAITAQRDKNRDTFLNWNCIEIQFRDFKPFGARRTNHAKPESDSDLALLHAAAQEYNKAEAKVPDGFFAVRNYDIEYTTSDYAQYDLKGLIALVASAKKPGWVGFDGTCQKSEQTIKALEANKRAENEAFDQMRFTMLAYYGFRVAAMAASNFCQRLTNELPV